MTTDIYNISNAKTICRTLPFFVRGRKMILFLEAAASPLISLHKTFLKWVMKMIIKTKITSQIGVLIWYLNYLFKERFLNESDSFDIDDEVGIDWLTGFNYREIAMYGIVGVRIFSTEENEFESEYSISKPTKDINKRLDRVPIIVHAPKLNGEYTEADYVRDILEVIDEYKTSFREWKVVINDN